MKPCRPYAALLSAAWLMCIVGCGSAEPYHAISGKVTVDQQPLAKGVITLYPTGPGTTVGGEIVDGQFSLPEERGPTPGSYRVEIVAFRPSGKKEFDVDLNTNVDVEVQYLPAKYNTKSELTLTVNEGENAPFDFKLDLK